MADKQDGDWFHAILEHLNKQPINGQWHDLSEIYGEGKPIYFDQSDRIGGFKRVADVIRFLVDRNFIKYSPKIRDGVKGVEFANDIGKVRELGEPLVNIEFENKSLVIDVVGDEKSWSWDAQLLTEGHTYITERQHDKTQRLIYKATLAISFVALLATATNVWISCKREIRERAQQTQQTQIDTLTTRIQSIERTVAHQIVIVDSLAKKVK